MRTLWEIGEAQGAWERRSMDLADVRPALVETLADMLECAIDARIEHQDILALRVKLGEWLDGLHDGELEDRIAVERGLLEEWDRP